MGKQETFGGWLKELRGERTQSEFAAKLGIDQSYLGRIERDDRPPNEILCVQIARAEGISLDFVLAKAGLPLVGETSSNEYDTEIEEIRNSLARFTSPEARSRAIDAALAVIESLADAERKDKDSSTHSQRAPARRPATS